jgi:hypothetical protein
MDNFAGTASVNCPVTLSFIPSPSGVKDGDWKEASVTISFNLDTGI